MLPAPQLSARRRGYGRIGTKADGLSYQDGYRLSRPPCRPETGASEGLHDRRGELIMIGRKNPQRARIDLPVFPDHVLDLHCPTDTRMPQNIRVFGTEIAQELR